MENMSSEIRQYSFSELKKEMAEEDLMFNATAGITVGGTWIDLKRLIHRIECTPEFNVVYKTISTAHLRVVKVNEYEEFLEWKRQRK